MVSHFLFLFFSAALAALFFQGIIFSFGLARWRQRSQTRLRN